MKNPKVSVTIPCYNAERFIGETLRSALGQTYTDLEVIVIDDGSTDNTALIVKSFADSRIRYFYKENKGVSIARNMAIRHSKGQYIAFLDSDDLWFPEKIDLQVKEIEKEKDIHLVYSGFYVIDGKGAIIDKFAFKNPSNILKDLVLRGNVIGTSSGVLVKKNIFESMEGFNPSLSTAADWDLWIRISRKYKVAYIDNYLFKYRNADGSMHHNVKVQEQDTRKILFNFFNGLSSQDSLCKMKRVAMSNAYLIIAKSYFEQRNISNFFRSIFMSGLYYPFNIFVLIRDMLHYIHKNHTMRSIC